MNRVLIVDDNPMILELLTAEFKNASIDVITAIDGLEALNLLKENEVSGILLDLFMPNMDGLQFIENIGHSHKDLPIVIMSGSSNPEIKAALHKKGISTIFLKPLTDENLKHIFSLIKSV